MSDNSKTYMLTAGMGAIAGMRSVSAPALLSRHLRHRKQRSQYKAARVLGSRSTATVLSLLAAGEMIADKTPSIPDRTELPSLAGRAFFGAVCGAVIGGEGGKSQVGAAILGASAAVGTTYAVHTVRKKLSEHLEAPDAVLGLIEDAVVYTIGSRLAATLQ